MRTDWAIGHLDADCFYVSAERVRNPFLLEKPVGVLGNQGACVIAKSYEMKGYGVKTGSPIWDALKLCPNGIYVKRDFRWYEVLSLKMLECVKEFSPRVEFYSIDEFFFVAVPIRGLTLQETAAAIRDSIWDRVRVPVTVGIAGSKTLAKLFSDSAKPKGARVAFDKDEVHALLKELPITEVSGIQGRRAARLAPWGIRNCLEFAEADRRLIRSLLTSAGETLWWELNGEPSMAIQVNRPRQQTLSRGGSLWVATGKPGVLWAWLVRNLERLIAELQYHDVCAGRLAVWVAYTSGETGLGRERMTVPTQRFDSLLEAARRCLRRAWIPRAMATRMQVFAEDLSMKGRVQYGLFDAPSESADGIARVKRAVNERYGRPVLRSGATLPIPHVYDDMANSYDICDIRGKFCF